MKKKINNILGINAYHGDSSVCLVQNGKLIAAVEEERFSRVKHWAGFPSQAILYCLREGGLTLREIDAIAINSDPKVSLFRKIMYVLMRRPHPSLLFDRLANLWSRVWVRQASDQTSFIEKFTGKVASIEHHTAHLASSFFPSPFQKAVVVSVDAFGDFTSTSWGVGHDSKIQIDGRVYFPHSLGIFYQALTQYLGFLNYGDEYKVMGLAPYGKPIYLSEMREIVLLKEKGVFNLNLDFFLHHQAGVEYRWEGGRPYVGILFSHALEGLLGKARKPDEELTQRHKDIARSVQCMYEEAFFHLLNALHKKYKSDSLALSGGCAMNSVANGKICLRTPFKRVYVQAAAGDAGGSIGAAFSLWHKLNPHAERFPISHASWGEGFSDKAIERSVESSRLELEKQSCEIHFIDDDKKLCDRVAESIALGKVVGWFQGRMEWGPRALGNRSILGDPRRTDMKDILNLKIKRRESFRPFAPSVLREKSGEWFEVDDDVPFMEKVFQIRSEKRYLIPAVTHVDGSGRLQTVSQDTNPLYYQLIKSFQALTDVPIILNTSFNENEPIVCRPEEALDCFLRTKMDILVMGHFILERSNSSI